MTAYIGLEGTETRGNETNGKITNMALRRLYPFVISYANNCIDKSANSCSLADEFDFIVEREGKVKHMSLYHQRRFAKLGYSAASILNALPLLQMLLRESGKCNLLVQACRMYVQCEIFIELHVLAYFTHKVTLPLLNCVEVCDQLYTVAINISKIVYRLNS